MKNYAKKSSTSRGVASKRELFLTCCRKGIITGIGLTCRTIFLVVGAVLLIWGCSRNASETQIQSIEPANENIWATGPLHVHPINPRYFTNKSNRAIYLTGSHFWENFQDLTSVVDYIRYLDFLKKHNHNFVRLWVWETPWQETGWELNPRWVSVTPIPYQRTADPSYGKARDGDLKFDLSKFNQVYFDRMRERVIAAKNRGIYVSIMLFQGYSVAKTDMWSVHPFNKENNINNVNGDLNLNGTGEETHTLAFPPITALQKIYVSKVIDTVNDLDNVLYEISNEDTLGSTEWQYHIINFIRQYEAAKGKHHPAGMTFQAQKHYEGNNIDLFRSPADWVSPGTYSVYAENPPAADGRKVIISDTDHLWGIGGNHQWVWKSFLRGFNPIFMDPYTSKDLQNHSSQPEWELIRKNMGYTLTYSKRVDLASMVPQNDLSSSTYCLANPGREYLIYLPSLHPRRLKWFYRLGLHKCLGWAVKLAGWNETAIVDLSASSGTYRVEWLNPRTGEAKDGRATDGGARRSFTSPFTGDAVLYICRP